MFNFGAAVGVHDDRVQAYLKNELDPPLTQWNGYERNVDDEGFAHYKFPGMGEKQFSDISKFLMGPQGVTLHGVDDQLTAKKMKKLTELITEWEEIPTNGNEKPKLYPPGGNGFVDLVGAIEKTLHSWNARYVAGFYTDEKNRADDYQIDLSELLEIYKDKVPPSKKDEMGEYSSKETKPSNLSEQKVRKLIRKTIRK